MFSSSDVAPLSEQAAALSASLCLVQSLSVYKSAFESQELKLPDSSSPKHSKLADSLDAASSTGTVTPVTALLHCPVPPATLCL